MNQTENKTCLNCKYMLWLVGIGQGVICTNKESEIGKKSPPMIPSRYHTCEKFKEKKIADGNIEGVVDNTNVG